MLSFFFSSSFYFRRSDQEESGWWGSWMPGDSGQSKGLQAGHLHSAQGRHSEPCGPASWRLPSSYLWCKKQTYASFILSMNARWQSFKHRLFWVESLWEGRLWAPGRTCRSAWTLQQGARSSPSWRPSPWTPSMRPSLSWGKTKSMDALCWSYNSLAWTTSWPEGLLRHKWVLLNV